MTSIVGSALVFFKSRDAFELFPDCVLVRSTTGEKTAQRAHIKTLSSR